jgi:hypothetical protein
MGWVWQKYEKHEEKSGREYKNGGEGIYEYPGTEISE